MSIQNELFYMKTFPVPLLSCHVPLLYAFHFFILVKQDKKKYKQAKKLLDLLGIVWLVFYSHSAYEQSKDECREQQQNEGEIVENAALLF